MNKMMLAVWIAVASSILLLTWGGLLIAVEALC
jgi:hypothetical protein